jgi:hypothetical protein
MDEEGAKYQQVARLQYQEIERLRLLIAQRDTELDGLVGWIAGDQGALEVLQSIYVDPRQSPANRIKSASSAIGFERSKPVSMSVNAGVLDFAEYVRSIRLKQAAKDRARWDAGDAAAKAKTIEATVLDSSPPLASDHEGAPALGPEADPAV